MTNREWIPSSKRSTCDLCGNASGWCSTSATDDDTITCKNTTTAPNGWKKLKDTADGGGVFKPISGENYTRPERTESPKTVDESKYRSADHQTRDRVYRRLISNSGDLGATYRDELERRGLSSEQIDIAIERDWFGNWQRSIASGFHSQIENIAGIDPTTAETCSCDGLWLPAIKNGSIVGGQIYPKPHIEQKLGRPANVPDDLGKYVWLSSSKHGGANAHCFDTGENPLFLREHPNTQPDAVENLNLCEGALKSAIAYLKFEDRGQFDPFIGAAGGRFSKNEVKQCLDRYPNLKTVTLYPDSGSIENPSIVRNYSQAAELIRNLTDGRVKILVAWWNQLTKADRDVDELTKKDLENLITETWDNFIMGKPSVFYQQISKSPETLTNKGVEGADKNQHLSALSADELKGRIESIFVRGLTGADRESALVALAGELRVHKQSVEGIYRELERASDASADNVDIEKLLLAQRQRLSPHVVFPERIATKIEQIANARGTNPEPLILGMLIAASSVPHANTGLNVANHGDVLSVYPNLFGMNVGDSGSLKSPTNATAFTKPLRALQKTYIDKYEVELQTYESGLQEWEKQDKKERKEAPKPPRLVVVLAEDATMEKIEDLALHQPSICPGIYRDELIGIFQAFDKHGGKGSNDSRSKLLSYYDGSPINIHRVGTGSKISKHHYHPVVFGGIQPEVLKDLARSIGMDNDGTLCRFLYAPVNRQYKAWDEDHDTEKIDTNVFSNLIENIHRLQAIECWLDKNSQQAWARVTNHYNHECLNNPKLSAWLKHAYSKAIGQLGKIALTLHLIECAEAKQVSGTISKLTIERAAIALDYFISQSVALIASTEETLEAHLLRIFDKAKKLGTINPRVVQSLFSGKKRIDSTTARNYLDTLADSGYGSIDDKGVFTPKLSEPMPNASADNADKVLIVYQQLQHRVDIDLSVNADNVDKHSDLVRVPEATDDEF
jgi:hypothetical protein